MKISNKQYAQALYESVQGKSKKEIQEMLRKFVVLLQKERALSRSEQITQSFVKLYNQENGIVAVHARNHKGLDKNGKMRVMGYIKLLTKASEVELTEIKDEKMLGGVILKYGDKIIDGSLRTGLNRLKAELKK